MQSGPASVACGTSKKLGTRWDGQWPAQQRPAAPTDTPQANRIAAATQQLLTVRAAVVVHKDSVALGAWVQLAACHWLPLVASRSADLLRPCMRTLAVVLHNLQLVRW
jgi:hypothetical protein